MAELDSLIAIAIAALAAAYMLWRWLKPFFSNRSACCKSTPDPGELLQIDPLDPS